MVLDVHSCNFFVRGSLIGELSCMVLNPYTVLLIVSGICCFLVIIYTCPFYTTASILLFSPKLHHVFTVPVAEYICKLAQIRVNIGDLQLGS
jgi:hypothetical protein